MTDPRLITQRLTSGYTQLSPEITTSEKGKVGQNKLDAIAKAEKEFNEVEKKFKKIGGGVAGVSALVLIGGVLRNGWTFPAKALQTVGDFFGSIAAIAAPVFIAGNEIKNHKLLKGANEKDFQVFDDLKKGFYRCASLGFTPFIFEPFVNPEKFGKSAFHKLATVANIPNLIFTGYTWGIGNLKALILWCLRKKEQSLNGKALKEGNHQEADLYKKRAEAFNQLYDGCERSAVIGSIANPTLQGLRQWADSMAFLTGKIPPREFFEKPFLGVSRLVSLIVGIPETFAKGVDSLVRVIKERENLKPALPRFLKSKKAFQFAENLEKKFSGQDNLLKSIRHYAEILFHTLSPLSMFALFTPLLDESHINEEAQAHSGLAAKLNKGIGIYGKTLTVVFTGLYVTLARLPQAIFQMSYFGKKLKGKITRKEASINDLNDLKKKICDSRFVNSLSNTAKRCIEKLVPDFYTREHDHGYLTYEQIQANYSFDQAREHNGFKKLLQDGNVISDDDKNKIVAYCLEYVEKDASQGGHKVTSEERNKISEIIKNKINYTTDPKSKPKRTVKLPFIGAEFLATYVFKLFDLKTRLQAIDYRSSHHNMTTAYDNDEKRISFEYELLPVIAKCTKGLGNTVNRLFGIAV
ncbi:MAG: hypothetical protein HY094_09300 [Candidatus Melainabacteria bacterium]|nr:hypothetical protein [Candidatus Melainabacteria bacterium]